MDVLQNSVRYIQRFYSMVKDNNGPVESLGEDDPVRHDLAVLQQAMSKLQHAYGVIATRTTATDLLKLKPSTVRPRQESKRGKWAVEDDKRLLELRDYQGLPWGHIFELFPGRIPGAIQLRYYTMSRKENGTPSREKRHQSHKSSANRQNRPSRPVNVRSTRARPHNVVGGNLAIACSSESSGTDHIAASLSQRLENVDPRILGPGDRMW
ncbi:hypothetical protein BDV26DRAFT_3321 [Aspergillus bertholletiae]|uniref:Myb-like domain-containing protein n=1 Tax=Aspergillus bertholletiae TaxID=1226010 RepID=A0A5N7BPY1_9EURO|nr:hypothetical protein BDV26DRAFT_3321 [Aspergillus bertholletiae]